MLLRRRHGPGRDAAALAVRQAKAEVRSPAPWTSTRPAVREGGLCQTAMRDGFGRSRVSITPVRVELVGEGRHPVVGKDGLQRLPNNKRWIVDIGHCHEQVGPMDGEALPAYPTRA